MPYTSNNPIYHDDPHVSALETARAELDLLKVQLKAAGHDPQQPYIVAVAWNAMQAARGRGRNIFEYITAGVEAVNAIDHRNQ